MTASCAGPTDDAARATLEGYLRDAFGLAVAAMKFLGGELDRNYRVTTAEGGTYLAKLRLRVEDRGELQWQEDILVHLAGKDIGVAIPTVVTTTDGRLNLRVTVGAEPGVLRVLDWVPGTELARVADHSDALLAELGATAAMITRALEGFTSTELHSTHHWDITHSRKAIEVCIADDPPLADMPYVRTVLDWFDAVTPRLDSLPRAMVHHDLNDNNVLVGVRDGVQFVSGVLDFNDALHSPRVAEVAVAGAYAMLRKNDPLGALGRVVAGYHKVTPLTSDELDVLYPLAAARLCVQVLTWTTRGRADPTAYGSMRMQYTLPTLLRVVSIDPAVAAAHLRAACGIPVSPALLEARKLVEKYPAASILDVMPFWGDRSAPAALAAGGSVEAMETVPVLGSAHLSAHAHRADIWRPGIGEPETISLGTSFWTRYPAGLHAPFAGRVLGVNPLIIEHTAGTAAVHSIWHEVAARVGIGDCVAPGQFVAEGRAAEAGGGPGWRVQLVADRSLATRMPAYVRPTDAPYWAAVCIDPAPLFATISRAGEPRSGVLERGTTRVALGSARTPVRGSGVWLYDANGIRYLDAVAAAHVAHGDPRIVAAAHRQMQLLATTAGSPSLPAIELAQRLADTLPDPLDTVLFVNTAGEARELALQLARRATGRRTVLAIAGADHGLALGGPVGLSGPAHTVLLPDRFRGPYSDTEASAGYAADVARVVADLAGAATPPAAFLAQPVIGAGVHPLPAGYLEAAYGYVRAAGGLCVADESTTGVGRAGTQLWGFEAHGVVPDIVTIGPGLGNGHPIAAIVTSRELAQACGLGRPDIETFAANPVTGAIGSVVLDIIESDGLRHRAADMGSYLVDTLTSLRSRFPLIGDVRGRGLTVGLDLVTDPGERTPAGEYARAVRERLRDHSVMVGRGGADGNVLTITPPMVFSRTDVDLLVERLSDVLAMADILPAATTTPA